ncbi:hypothetical protein Tco_0802607 [Tanacetum coccineum]|uniref:RNA-directed DNA polymerase, eukaryota n=1 Tax=Tanacetum coccineum TaxID=301880 RepID=A0ABQ4ZZ99_9ASTR
MKEGNEQQAPKTGKESEDPFGIYSILKRNNQKEKSKDAGKSDPSFPPGFTPKRGLGHTSKKDWIRELNLKYKVNFATIQETKSEKIDLFAIKSLWGNFNFDFVYSPSVGLSGGILCVWNPNVFAKESVTVSDSFVAVRGYSFTWALKSSSKMSKLDRFLIYEGLILIFPLLAAICLDRRLSDHRPILLRESSVDYGPTPFRVFHSWFTKDGFDNLVADTWNNLSIMETNKISLLRKKFQALKAIIKNWSRDEMLKASAVRHSAQSRISELDKLIDKGLSNNDIINERISLLKDIHDLDKRHSSDLAQKAKIQWAIESVKNLSQTINLDSHMFQKISIDQNADLESDVSLEEIKKRFWKLPRGSLEEEQFSKLIEDVNSVILSVSNDRWIWPLDSSGEFSIKSTRLFIDDHLLLAVGAPTIWVYEGIHARILLFTLVLWPGLTYKLLDGGDMIARYLFSYDMCLNGFSIRLLKVLRIY